MRARRTLTVKVPAMHLVDPQLQVLEAESHRFAASLNPELQRIPPRLSTDCASCEYRGATDDPAVDGFRHCWGVLADVTPSVLDLYQAGNFKKELNWMIAMGRASIREVPETAFENQKGES